MNWSIHHVNLAANDVRETARFYAEILGFAEGSIFPSDSSSRGENSGLHLIKPEPEFARKNALDHNPSIGGHVAFQVDDLDGVINRLKAAGIAYSLTGTFAIPHMRHLYVYDPSMNLIEVNEIIA